MSKRADRAGHASDIKRRSLTYRQLATHRKGTPEHSAELRAEQQAYRDRFKKRPTT